MIHKLAHAFGWYYGTVESFWIKDDIWTGFRCSKCDVIDGAHISSRNAKEKAEKLPTFKEAQQADDMKNALGVLGALLKHLDLGVRKKWEPDPQFALPEPKMHQVYEVYNNKV